jgi:hypothetical protein
MLKKIVAVRATSDTKLVVWFLSGEVRQYDADNLPASQVETVHDVTVKDGGDAIVWSDGYTIDCDTVYDESVDIDVVGAECERVIKEVVVARRLSGLSQARLAMAAGMKQPVVARLETQVNSPRIDTLLKVLNPLGKTLKIVDLADVDNRFESVDD